MKHNKAGLYADILFVLIQLTLYAAFLYLDLTDANSMLSRNIKYCVILLCFCYALVQKNSADRSIIFCIKAALLFTLISDLFLLLLDYSTYGVLTFIVVQQLYGVRLKLAECNVQVGRLLFRKLSFRFLFQLTAALCIIIVLALANIALNGLLTASVFYFICIASNAVSAVKTAIASPGAKGSLLFAAGMVLFLLCDINVGLFNLSGFISMPEGLFHFADSVSAILMWTFYAPSQVLITLSISTLSFASSFPIRGNKYNNPGCGP